MWSRVLFLGLFVAVVGCDRAQLQYQAASLNRAVANSEYKQLFLNAVRASLDLPISFTRLRTFTGKERASGKFDPSLPFGGDASHIFNIGPEISLSSGISAAEYANVNVAESLEELNRPLKNATYLHLINNGYSPLLLATIMFNRVEAHSDLVVALIKVKNSVCHSTAKSHHPSCSVVDQLPHNCDKRMSRAKLDEGQKFVGISNVGSSRCEYSKFQSFYHLLRLSRMVIDLIQTKVAVPGTDQHGNAITKVVPSEELRVYFQNEYTQSIYEEIKARLVMLKIDKIRNPLKVTTRSPKGIIAYLGELIRLQRSSPNPNSSPLTIMTGSGDHMAIFNTTTGGIGTGRVALSVSGPDGKRYSIPYPDYSSTTRDQSLRVLSATSDLINIAIAGKALPSPSTLVIR